MYMNKLLSVSKASNGFVIEVQVPLKPTAKPTNKMTDCCSPSSSCEKQYVTSSAKETADVLEDLLPLLDGEYKTEGEFDKAFTAACGDSEMEDD